MTDRQTNGPLQPGERAPNVVLDAITRQGKVSLDDFRGHSPVLIGLFRGLHCPFCRRQIAAMAQLDSALRQKGIESLAVINTPIERARLYFRYHPMPNLLAAADPERASHRAFGLPTLEYTENESDWPRKLGMNAVMNMRLQLPELSEPMNPVDASEVLNKADGYETTADDQKMMATGSNGQLIGEFLLDRDGIVRWSFTEVPEGGRRMFGLPNSQELMSAASQVAN